MPLPHTQRALARAILKDLAAGQSTADSTAGRLRVDARTVEALTLQMMAEAIVEIHLIADRLTVYRITQKGLQTLLDL